MSRALPAILIGAALACGCLPSPERVEADINSALRPGASAEEIEAYFRANELGFTYNRITNSYSSLIKRKGRPFKEVLVQVHLDEQRRFVRAEVMNVYTFL